MEKEQIFQLINANPAFSLATIENGEPRVRIMALYKADETGIVFHTGPFKDVYKQMNTNKNVQMVFYDAKSNTQIRVRGEIKMTNDIELKREISSHPSRGFMQGWKVGKTEEEFFSMFSVFRLKNGKANIWTFQTNFDKKVDIVL